MPRFSFIMHEYYNLLQLEALIHLKANNGSSQTIILIHIFHLNTIYNLGHPSHSSDLLQLVCVPRRS